jgi:hypothetical protein
LLLLGDIYSFQYRKYSMPPNATVPLPEGHIYFSYSPISPPNWGIAPFDVHVFVYSDIRIALEVIHEVATTIQAQRLECGSAGLFTRHLLFRGNSDVTQRLLPTHLRGPWSQPPPRERFSVADPPMVKVHGVNLPSVSFDPGGADARLYWGDWFERVEPMRTIEDSMADVSQEDIHCRDALERAAVERASQLPEVASLGPFQRRGAVRHYGRVLSPLLDVSASPEVAAFFATGGASQAPTPGTIGMLWAIDLNFFQDFFELKTTSIPGGKKTNMTEQRDKWGVNKRLFEEYGVLPTPLELTSVELPFQRPQAQHARFLSIAKDNGAPLPAKTEFTWWSIIERRAYGCAFIQDGRTYENPNHNITAASLWPVNEPLVNALAHNNV